MSQPEEVNYLIEPRAITAIWGKHHEINIGGIFAEKILPFINSFPQSVNIGVIASRFTNQDKLFIDGTHQVAAIFMAFEEINNKNDGLYDDLLPNTQLKFALRGPKQSFLGGLEAVQDFTNTVFGGQGVKAVIG
eukprot:gene2477-4820_t